MIRNYNKVLKVLGVVILFIVFGVGQCFGQLSGYANYKVITVDNTKVEGAGPHANFPVLIHHTDADLKSTANGGDVQSVNGFDIRFTESDGITLLPHQIESYDPLTGEIAMWVSVSVLSTIADTDIRMYFGNSAITLDPSTTDVWDADYRAVYHFNGDINDKTSSQNNLTNGGTSDNVNGVVANGRLFGSEDELSLNNATSLQLAGSMSASVWIDFNALGTSSLDNPLLGCGKSGESQAENHLYYFNVLSDGRMKLTWESGTGTNHNVVTTSTASLAAGYSCLSFTRDASTKEINFYENGVLVEGPLVYATGPDGGTTGNFRMGALEEDDDMELSAKVDETRISSIVRSATWLRTSYNSISSPITFYTYGAKQAAAPAPEWCWAKPIVASSNEVILDVAADANNYYYAVGYFNGDLSGTFSTGLNNTPDMSVLLGSQDGLVAKYSNNGQPIWAFKIGASGESVWITSVEVGASNNVFVAGYFDDRCEFQGVTTSSTNLVLGSAGSTDAFLACYDSDGNLQWVKHGANSGRAETFDLAVNTNDVFITGSFENTLNITGGSGITSADKLDVFVTSYTQTGTFNWMSHVKDIDAGNNTDEFGYGVEADDNAVFVTGDFERTIEFQGGATLTATTPGKSSIYVAELALATGNATWSDLIGSDQPCYGRSITTDAVYVYVGGAVEGAVEFPLLASPISVNNSSSDPFIAAIKRGSRVTDWTEIIDNNSSNDLFVEDLVTDGTNLYSVGNFKSTFEFGDGSDPKSAVGNVDGYVMALNVSGSYLWSGLVQDNEEIQMYGLALDANGSLITGGGMTNEAMLSPVSITVDESGDDGFLAKFVCTGCAGPNITSCPGNITVTADASCSYTLGDYTGAVTVTDNCGGGITVTQSPADASVLEAGLHTILMTATDMNGNYDQCSFQVQVEANVNARVVGCGDALTGQTTIGKGNNADNFTCVGFATPGEDQYYQIDVPPGNYTLQITLANVSDANNSFLDLFWTGSTCPDGTACDAVESFNIATQKFGHGTNKTVFSAVGPETYFLVVDAENVGINSYDISFDCLNSGIVFDTSNCDAVNDPDKNGVVQKVNGSMSDLTVDPCESVTVCHEFYVANYLDAEWLDSVRMSLGSCYENVTNYTPNGVGTQFYEPGGGDWLPVFDSGSNSIAWTFNNSFDALYGDGVGSEYSCGTGQSRKYEFCFDANITKTCATNSGLNVGLLIGDDGVGTGGGTVQSIDVMISDVFLIDNVVNTSITAPASICSAVSTTLTAGGGLSYLWSTGATTAAINVGPVVTTPYVVSITTPSGCLEIQSTTLTVNTNPTAGMSGDKTICVGESTVLSGTGGVSYVWSTGETTNTITLSPTVTTNYGITATDGNGCVGNKNGTVFVNPLPVLTVTGVTTICSGENITLTAAGGLSYVWSSGEASSTMVQGPLSSTSFTVTTTDGNACVDTETVSVTVNAVPSVTISGNTTLCNGESTTLTASGGMNYLWSTGQTTATASHSPSSTTPARVTVTNTGGCVSVEVTTITVNPVPVITITGNTTICEGESTNLVASGGATYAWSTGGGMANQSLSPPATASYNVTASLATGCSASKSVTVTVLTVPGVTVTGTTLMCEGDAASVSVVGPGTYLWSNAQTTASASYSFSSSSSASVTITGSNGCTNTSSHAVVVNSSITDNTISADQSLCSGASPTALLGSPPSGGVNLYTYQWMCSVDGVTFVDVPGAVNLNYSPGAVTVTSHYVRKVESGACTASFGHISDTVLLVVIPQVSGNSISADQNICYGSPVSQLNGAAVAGGDGAYTYIWEEKIGAGSWSTVAATANYQPVGVTTTSAYRRTVESGACAGVYATVSNEVTVDITPNILNNTITDTQYLCANEAPDPLAGSLPSGGNSIYTYVWESSIDGVVYTPIPGAVNQNYSPPITTVTSYFRRVVNSGNCSNESNVVVLNIDAAISNNVLSGVQTICGGETPSGLSGSVPVGGDGLYTYLWEQSLDSTIWSDCPVPNTGLNYSPGQLVDTTYYRRTVFSGACSAGTFQSVSEFIAVTVLPALDQNKIFSPQLICETGIPAPVIGSVPNGGDGTFWYDWEISSSPGVWVPAAGINSTLSYTFTLGLADSIYVRRIVSSNSCSGPFSHISDSMLIAVEPALGNNIVDGDFGTCVGSGIDTLFGQQPTGGNGSYAYTWEQNTGGGWSTVPGIFANSYYVPSSYSDTIQFRRIVESGQCVGPDFQLISDVIDVAVLPDPVIYLALNDTLCEAAGTLNMDAMMTYQSYETPTFSSSDGAVVSGSILDLAQTGPGNFNIDVLLSNPYCETNQSFAILVLPDYFPDITVPDTVCADDAVLTLTSYLDNNATTGGTWTAGGVPGESWSLNGLSGTQVITYTVGEGLCEESGSASVHVQEDVDPSWSTPGSLCNPSDTVPLASLVTGTVGGSFTGDGVENGNFIVTQAGVGTSDVSYTLQNGSCNETSTQVIEVVPFPYIVLSETDSVCGFVYEASPTSNASFISWTPMTGGAISNTSILRPTILASTYGQLTFKIQASQPGGCVVTDSITVMFEEELLDPMVGFDTTVVNRKTIDLVNPGGSGLSSWNVTVGDGAVVLDEPVYKFDEMSLGQNQVIHEYQGGICPSFTTEFNVTVLDLSPPTGFSPNGDGVNDLYVIDGLADELNVYFAVFNRWGNKLFEDADYQNNWDGMFKGAESPNDTYFYVLTLTDGTTLKGFFELKK